MSFRMNHSALALVAGLSCMVGCASLTSDSASKSKKKDKSWFSFTKKEYQVPQSMNVTWAYDILTVPGKPPTRGFGGRFYFYNEKSQAIPVDGELIVYGFDDTQRPSDTTDLNSAVKRFKFTPEQLTNHFDEGQLGASYSVWIPWDAAPGDQKKIMVMPTFMAKDGRMVRGNTATLHLPGKTPPSMAPTQGSSNILQVSANIPVSSGSNLAAGATQAIANAQANRPGITTINMPRRVAAPNPTAPNLVEAFDRLEALHREEQERQLRAVPPTFHPVPDVTNHGASMNGAVPGNGAVAQNNNAYVPNQTDSTTAKAFFAPPPSSMNLVSANRGIQNLNVGGPANGWALPQFVQPAVTQPSGHLPQNQPPAPTSQFVPPTSYQQLLPQNQ
jgi:hypothetical protein